MVLEERKQKRNTLEESDLIFEHLGWLYCSIAALIPFKSDFTMLFYMEASHSNRVYRVFPHRCGY